METVAAYTILAVKLIGQCIHIGVVGHGLVEGCVEHSYLWNVGQQGCNGVNTLYVCGIVQGRQVVACAEGFHDFGGEKHAFVELLTAVYHAVSYGIQLVQAVEYGVVSCGEYLENPLYSRGMLFNRTLHPVFLSIELDSNKTVGQTYFLYAARGYDSLVAHVVERVFNGTASAVQY